MKIDPVITRQYDTRYLNVSANLRFPCNLCFVIGDSGTGKSFLWNILSAESSMVDYILTYNCRDINKGISEQIKRAKGKLIVIDNVDIILDEDIRRHIAFDTDNQYVLFGRDPSNLFLVKDNFVRLVFKEDTLSFEAAFG